MAILVTCSQCGQRYEVGEKHFGRTIACRGCGQPVSIPGRPPAVPPVMAPAPAELADESLAAWEAQAAPTALPGAGRTLPARQPDPTGEPRRNRPLSAGITCVVLGLGSFILPFLGIQFRLLMLFGSWTPLVGGLLSFVGIGLIAVGLRRNLAAAVVTTAALLVAFLGVVVGAVLVAGQQGAEPVGPGIPDGMAHRVEPAMPPLPPGPGPRGPRGSFPSPPQPGPPIRGPRFGPLSVPRPGQSDGEATPLAGGTGGGGFQDVVGAGQVVVGVRFAFGTWDNQDALSQLYPLSDRGSDTGAGDAVLARDGYALGALLVDSRKYVHAVRPIFYRQRGNRLDPSDAYEGDWIGLPQGDRPRRLDGGGRPVIGICGRKGLIIDAVGLILARS